MKREDNSAGEEPERNARAVSEDTEATREWRRARRQVLALQARIKVLTEQENSLSKELEEAIARKTVAYDKIMAIN